MKTPFHVPLQETLYKIDQKQIIMKQFILSFLLAAAITPAWAADKQQLTVKVSNPAKMERTATPVVIQLANYPINVKSAIVKLGNREIPCQLDDLNGDGKYDELCFLTQLGKKEKQQFDVTLSTEGTANNYPAQVYAEMMMSNKKIKASNKQDLYISSLTVDNGTNPYWMLHHHGPAFENDMVAYRIYFDHRQTVDIYGKYKKGLELKQTQFYPDKEQKAAGFGDDILWVGETFGLGAIRGWDGQAPQMLKDVEHRTLRILARAPLRTVVEVIDEGWKTPGKEERISMTTRYILYAGRRDCQVEVSFNRPATGYELATGIINVKNSTEMSNHKGLRGCWGTDWPVSEKDSAGHKRETVGLGICIPTQQLAKELPANKDNYPFVIGNIGNGFTYHITFGSDNESFGFHNAKDWFAYLEKWSEDVSNDNQVKVEVTTSSK